MSSHHDPFIRKVPISVAGGLNVLVDGLPFELSELRKKPAVLENYNLVLAEGSNDKVVVHFSASRISVSFQEFKGILSILFSAPTTFKGRTKGLLGTWNDNPSDDFTLPDGIVVPSDASPEEVHYKFGLKCKLSLTLNT